MGVRDDGDDGDVNVGDDGDQDVLDDNVGQTSKARQEWILMRLEQGHRLNAPAVAERLGRSLKTAERDLDALKKAGKIEFVGSARTGYYRLREPQSGSG